MKGQVQVYRNLHKTLEDGTYVYSVRNDKGIVEDHVTEIAIAKPILRVGPKIKGFVMKVVRTSTLTFG